MRAASPWTAADAVRVGAPAGFEAIREQVKYSGARLRTTAALAGARIPITVDIRFGDAVEPGVDDIHLPVLLDMSSPHLRA